MPKLDVYTKDVTNITYCKAVCSMLCHKCPHINMSNQQKLAAVTTLLLSVTAVYLPLVTKIIFLNNIPIT
jgi:hypothetical protein